MPMPVRLVRHDFDIVVVLVERQAVIRERLVVDLVDCVAGVGDQLPEEDLPLRVDRTYHQLKQPFRFGLKLLFHRHAHGPFPIMV
jgi:hypothetical protein